MFGGLFNNPIVNPIGYMNKQLFGGSSSGGGSGSGALLGGIGADAISKVLGNKGGNWGSNSGSNTMPWSQNNQSMNGQNFKTTNFGYDAEGRPNALPFETVRDSSGNLGSGFTLNSGPGINLNTSAYDKYLGEATSNGPSSWAMAAMDENNNATMNNVNKASMMGANMTASGMGNLQMSGGMSGSQRERAILGGNRDSMKARMDALNAGNANNMNIMTNDAKAKSDMLLNAQNMSLQNAQFGQDERDYRTNIDKINLGNKLTDVSNFNNYNQNMYNEAMKGWAALKSSDAQAKAAASQEDKGFNLFDPGSWF